jgi:hypothetical protein
LEVREMEILQLIVVILLVAAFGYAAFRWGVDSDTPANSSRDGRAVRWALSPRRR